jgi:hypothetical protein
MGIEPWMPIKTLPNAEADHWVAAPAVFKAITAANTELVDQPQSVTAQNIINRSLALAEQLDIKEPSKVSPKSHPATLSPTTPSPAVPETTANISHSVKSLDSFTLATTVCGDLLLIDDITQMNFASSAYQHWLNAILLSLGKKALPEVGGVQDRFEWPLADKDIFSAWLQRKLQENNIGWVLFMGKAAVAMQETENAFGHVTSVVHKQGKQNIKVLPTFGSGELWSQPLLKREFWQHIQPLRTNVSSDA